MFSTYMDSRLPFDPRFPDNRTFTGLHTLKTPDKPGGLVLGRSGILFTRCWLSTADCSVVETVTILVKTSCNHSGYFRFQFSNHNSMPFLKTVMRARRINKRSLRRTVSCKDSHIEIAPTFARIAKSAFYSYIFAQTEIIGRVNFLGGNFRQPLVFFFT